MGYFILALVFACLTCVALVTGHGPVAAGFVVPTVMLFLLAVVHARIALSTRQLGRLRFLSALFLGLAVGAAVIAVQAPHHIVQATAAACGGLFLAGAILVSVATYRQAIRTYPPDDG
ncbi:MAG: hypothetical protein JWO76_3215 [Nocardioides sp.]|nr:hypothetical protein [Nocardioides sp.]